MINYTDMNTQIKVSFKNGLTITLNKGMKGLENADKNRKLYILFRDGDSIIDVIVMEIMHTLKIVRFSKIDFSRSYRIPFDDILGWCYTD